MDIYEHILSNGGEDKTTFIVDVETTQRAPPPLFSASPFYDANEMIIAGALELWAGTPPNYKVDYTIRKLNLASKDKIIEIVGHNIKFDLHYLRREGLNMANVVCFDTQIAAYLLSNMTLISPTLEESVDYIAKLTGTTPPLQGKKLAWVHDLIEANKIEEVPVSDLEEYLQGDLTLTKWLYQAIHAHIKGDRALIGLLHAQMRMCLAVQEMEYNGMPVDREVVDGICKEALTSAVAIGLDMGDLLSRMVSCPEGIPLDPTTVSLDSNLTLNCVMNGQGHVKSKVLNPAGKPKWLHLEYAPIGVAQLPTSSFDEAHIVRRLADPGLDTPDQIAYLKLVSGYREVTKLLSTFIDPYIEIMNITDKDCLNPSINQAIAATGRTTCSKPNAQQIPEAIRKMFRQPGHLIISADYSQLELCGLAHRVGPGALQEDIKAGVDIHAGIGKEAHGTANITKEMRTRIKNVVFGWTYGGGAIKLAKESGLPLPVVKRIIHILTTKYPELPEYYKDVLYYMEPIAEVKWVGGQGFRQWNYNDSETHRTYRFTENMGLDYKTGKQAVKQPWTTTRNYPVQGLATGDWVPCWVALLITYQRWYDKNKSLAKYKQIMAIHDESLGKVATEDKEEAEKVGKIIAAIGEKLLPKLYERWTGADIAVPLKVNIKIGPTW